MSALIGFLTNLPWQRFVPPHTTHDLLIDQLIASLTYLFVSLILSVGRRKTRPFDISYVIRAAVSGASLPATLTLASLPLFPDVQTLFGETTMQAYIMIAGLILSVLSLYALFK